MSSRREFITLLAGARLSRWDAAVVGGSNQHAALLNVKTAR
jgi:hypothetical protein